MAACVLRLLTLYLLKNTQYIEFAMSTPNLNLNLGKMQYCQTLIAMCELYQPSVSLHCFTEAESESWNSSFCRTSMGESFRTFFFFSINSAHAAAKVQVFLSACPRHSFCLHSWRLSCRWSSTAWRADGQLVLKRLPAAWGCSFQELVGALSASDGCSYISHPSWLTNEEPSDLGVWGKKLTIIFFFSWHSSWVVRPPASWKHMEKPAGCPGLEMSLHRRSWMYYWGKFTH